MNTFTKLFGIAGLTTLTALTTMGMGTVNVLADNAKLPAYVMDGTNAERAISDYFVNKTEAVNENSVVIPHMDIAHHAELEIDLRQRHLRRGEHPPPRQRTERRASAEEKPP